MNPRVGTDVVDQAEDLRGFPSEARKGRSRVRQLGAPTRVVGTDGEVWQLPDVEHVEPGAEPVGQPPSSG